VDGVQDKGALMIDAFVVKLLMSVKFFAGG
jgi:hypothetical protein